MHLGMQQILSTSMQQRQQLVMTPAMVQAIRLLQLNAMELEQEVVQELEENPFLELADDQDEEDGSTPPDGTAEDQAIPAPTETVDDGLGEVEPVPDKAPLEEASASAEQVETEEESTPPDLLELPDHTEDNDPGLDEFYQETYGDAVYATAERQDEDRDFSQVNSDGETLYDHLVRQLHVTDLDERATEIGEYLIGNIDEKGYLKVTVEEVAEHFGATAEEVEAVLGVIQLFDPVGVGARDIRECLTIQIRAGPNPDEAMIRLVSEHFDDLAHRRHKAIARAMKIPEKRVVELGQRIAHLEPKPGRAISVDRPQYILPDVVVTRIDGTYYISLNEGRTNHLRVSSYYRQRFHAVLAKNRERGKGEEGSNEGEAEYIKKKFNDAVVLIRNIERRKGTIFKISRAIMERQSDFLEKGVEHLHPMTLKDIAAEFPLKHVFSSGLESESGESQSSRSVRSRIREMIDNEDSGQPLSDQRIADVLKAEGIKIARRTVTKYREQLKILPTNMRRQA
jgi:RNA polymerase sigma-54 factor